jgi:hypothetical protein
LNGLSGDQDCARDPKQNYRYSGCVPAEYIILHDA